jgi:acid phosphatase (class A)
VEITTNRWICGLAWKSDVEAGRVLGSAVYSQLSGEPYYLELLRKARAELLAPRSK